MSFQIDLSREVKVVIAGPQFSIVIPTRNRPQLARISADYVLAQSFRDFELILLENSDTPQLSSAEFSDPRCSVVAAPQVLSMRDNWERALDLAKGRYVTVLSDKDMLVPGALQFLANAVLRTNAAMLTFRKAAHGNTAGIQSFIQRCSGNTVEFDGDKVLRAWFRKVQHFHDAPMIYNSMVRRDVILKLRAENGKFFVGTSPDVGSGATLLAELRSYHLIDRPLVVSKYGDWSIGAAAIRGKQGAAATAIAEYGRDPIRDAGLITGIPGSIAETLLECKKQFPTLFARYRLRWSGYVRSVLWDLHRRDQLGVDSTDERRMLRRAPGRPYTWVARLRGEREFRRELRQSPPDLWTRGRLGLRRLTGINVKKERTSASARTVVDHSRHKMSELVKSYFALSDLPQSSFEHVPYFALPISMSFESVMGCAIEINDHLSDQNIRLRATVSESFNHRAG